MTHSNSSFLTKLLLCLLLAILTIVLASVTVFNTVVHAQAEVVCEGLVGDASCEGETDTGPTIQGTIATLVNILSIVAGLVAVVMILIAGTRFLTSGGDSQKVSTARSALIYAVIGIIVVATSQIIVNFVIDQSSGTQSQSTDFDPTPGDGGNTVN